MDFNRARPPLEKQNSKTCKPRKLVKKKDSVKFWNAQSTVHKWCVTLVSEQKAHLQRLAQKSNKNTALTGRLLDFSACPIEKHADDLEWRRVRQVIPQGQNGLDSAVSAARHQLVTKLYWKRKEDCFVHSFHVGLLRHCITVRRYTQMLLTLISSELG